MGKENNFQQIRQSNGNSYIHVLPRVCDVMCMRNFDIETQQVEIEGRVYTSLHEDAIMHVFTISFYTKIDIMGVVHKYKEVDKDIRRMINMQ